MAVYKAVVRLRKGKVYQNRSLVNRFVCAPSVAEAEKEVREGFTDGERLVDISRLEGGVETIVSQQQFRNRAGCYRVRRGKRYAI